jgi:hypothetical protein
MVQNKHLNLHARCLQADTGAQAFELLLGIFNDDGGMLHAINPVRWFAKRLHLRSDVQQRLCQLPLPGRFFSNGLKQKEIIKRWECLQEAIKWFTLAGVKLTGKHVALGGLTVNS